MDSYVKKVEISTFLLQMQSLFIKHNFSNRNLKHIYKKVVTEGVSAKEVNMDLSDVFNAECERNRDNSKLYVFVSPGWRYFCQYRSSVLDGTFSTNPIKLYLPLKGENIQNSLKKIFDFITDNGIVHYSKLARDVRNDDLVIRVLSKEDADKIIEFVNSDPELTKDMYNPNPFCINQGKVGLAMDYRLSYNEVISKYLFYYLKEATLNNEIANYESFKFFIQRNLQALYDKDDLSEQIRNYAMNNLDDLPNFLQGLEEITEIILLNLEGGSKDQLYDKFKERNSLEFKRDGYKDFSYSNLFVSDADLFKDIITTMYYKYGEYATKENLREFKSLNDLSRITRSNNLRERVMASPTFRTYISFISIDEEMNLLFPKKGNLFEERVSKDSILEYVCKQTYLASQTEERHYTGKIQVASSLIYMKNHVYDRVTRTNNARRIAKDNIEPNEVDDLIRKTLEKNGYIIENDYDLYNLYATHIEYLCNSENKMLGGKL